MPTSIVKLSVEQQARLALHIKTTFSDYEKLNQPRHDELKKVYRAFATFKEKRKAEWQTTFKVNKAHEAVERVVPRIIAKNPRWVVEPKIEDFYADKSLPEVPDVTEESPIEEIEAAREILAERQKEVKKRQEMRNDHAKAIQDYLTYLFEEYKFVKQLRLGAKHLVVDGKLRWKIRWKWEMVQEFTEPKYNSKGEMTQEKDVKDVVYGQHPTIDVKSWTEVLTDPRYREVKDMPAYLELVPAARWADIKRNKKYFNLDKMEMALQNISARGSASESGYSSEVMSIAGINWTEKVKPDRNALLLCHFYGYWTENDLDPAKEKMVKVTMIKELGLIIGYEYITHIPFVEADCFEDTETNFSVGFVEPMMSLQDEMNFKKNSASEMINQSLNRTWIWSPYSGIDPRDLVSKPGGIIVTTRTGPEAMANCQELPQRQVPSDFFQEQNDIERQIQGQTFTVDTANQRSQQALTDTATGMRIEFFESNSVLDEVRKHFEQGLEELAYQLLQETFEHMEENIVFKKMGAEGYWEMHKEALRDAIKRYTIRVEVNSSSFDDVESRRKDAMAYFNMLIQAKEAGVAVNMEKGITEVMQTFEKRNPQDYLLPPDMTALAQQMPGAEAPPPEGGGAPPPMDPEDVEARPGLPPPADLTEQVAKGDITSVIQ